VLTGSFIAVLDTTIVNVALPSIQQGAHASSDALEWVVSGYALTFGLALVPAGPARRQVRLQTALPRRSSLGELPEDVQQAQHGHDQGQGRPAPPDVMVSAAKVLVPSAVDAYRGLRPSGRLPLPRGSLCADGTIGPLSPENTAPRRHRV
jgi:hypothetical protein